MILHVLIFKNKKIDAFTQPQFSDVEPEKAALQLARSLKLNEDPAIDKRYQDLDMYVLGTFDDSTGKCEWITPHKLLTCGEVIDSRKEEDAHADSN